MTVPSSTDADSVPVRVLLFAQVRLAAGRSEVDLDLRAPARLSDAIEALLRAHPEIEPHLATCRVAVGLDYATPDQPLRPGEEISVIPPVQGG